MPVAAITVSLPPEFDVLGLSVSWHGLMVSVGIGLALWISCGLADRRGLDREKALELGVATAVGGLLGAKFFYLLLNEPDVLLRPGDWLENTGFAIYGGVLGGIVALVLMIWLRRHSWRYLDVLALSFPLGLAVGRLGDLINGEHYGPPTDLPWGVIHTNPDASVPSNDTAYHDGGLYEITLGLLIFAIVWPLRNRVERPTVIFWLTIGLYGVGRFVMFFYREDTEPGILGLNVAQLTSVGFVIAAAAGLLFARRRFDDSDYDDSPIAAAAGYAAARKLPSSTKS
jgi:phosphatidylglycerol---prolipoprotein diacylglyceryl transferase